MVATAGLKDPLMVVQHRYSVEWPVANVMAG
jgi:hypothetical protein